MKILNFGSCNIDQVYSLDHIVRVGETQTTYKLETFPGGKGLNQSIAIARAGAKVYHAGCVGCDGDMLVDVLSQSGVDLSYLKRVDEKNGHAIIQVTTAGENSIFLYAGSNEMVSKEYVDSVLEHFGEGDIILLQNEISNIDYIVRRAYEKKMCIVFNPSPFNDKINEIDFSMISCVILNEVEAGEISKCESAEACLTFFKNNYPNIKVMLTLGSRGCIYMDANHEIFQSAFKVAVVDTTAAGDTFTGYFLAEISKGTDYESVLKIATAASAIAVSRSGAAPSIPCRDEVLAKLDDLTAHKSSKSDMINDKINSYLEENIKTASLDELAEVLGYSSVYTGALVKKLTGKSFSKLVQSKRCSMAADMLLSTDMSVHEIINAVGYENESFFRRIFKEKYGKNFLEYRSRGGK